MKGYEKRGKLEILEQDTAGEKIAGNCMVWLRNGILLLRR